MPTLDWIGKKAVVKHHKEVPYRLLEPVKKLSHGDPESGNLIVQGDNLHALKALLPRYAGKVKCIYIDPPYNTGNEGWVYNDNVNSPEIKQWLGEVVGKEAEDLSRHDKWLCMMYPRLVLLKKFLREDGAIFVSIDDNEVAKLRLLMDEVFGAKNFLANILWQKRTSPDARLKLSDAHEHIISYSMNIEATRLYKIPQNAKQLKNYKNPDNDHRGPWASTDFSAQGYRPNQMYEIHTPSGRIVTPPPGNCWKNTEDVFKRLEADDRIWFGKKGDGVPRRKTFLSESEGVSPWTWWSNDEVGHSQEAKKEINEIMSQLDSPFDTPKPSRLVQRILQITTDERDIVLDSFAGSGTTGHAVLKQNTEDGGNRKFIMVEMLPDIAENVTAERVKRVSKGYTTAKGKEIDGLGGGFQFCRLSSEPLFTPDGKVRSDVSFEQLAEFVWFAETGAGFPGKVDSPLLGVFQGRAVYLLYNGILKDKSVNGGNVLTTPILNLLPEHDGPKVIYAAACRLGQSRLDKLGVQFKQTPYALEV
jgi:site-specific DNA-methyltransferase (adenine-specific)/adenine-specific DNA-methyltransferase